MVDGPEALVAGLETGLLVVEVGWSEAIGGGGQVVDLGGGAGRVCSLPRRTAIDAHTRCYLR